MTLLTWYVGVIDFFYFLPQSSAAKNSSSSTICLESGCDSRTGTDTALASTPTVSAIIAPPVRFCCDGLSMVVSPSLQCFCMHASDINCLGGVDGSLDVT